MFATIFGALLLRNRALFTTSLYELGDSGANSIIIGQAKQLSLLVGNYSRQGFSHPGPAYFYVQALGEGLFHDLLRLVPTPHNGQLLAVYALNAASLATAAFIFNRHYPCGWAILPLTVFVVVQQPAILTDAWMPFLYVPSFLLFLVACASVAAGRATHLWAVALGGGLLVHGHVVFLLFVPVVAAAALLWLRMNHGFDRRQWAIGAGVFAVFLLPIAVNTLLRWPGEFGKYFGYGSSEAAGTHSIPESFSYLSWYWRSPGAWLAVLTLAAVAAAIVWRDAFLRAGLALGALVTLLLAYYAYAGIDDPSHPYMGYFYWSVPAFAVTAVLCLAAQRLPAPRYQAPLLVALALLLFAPGLRSGVADHDPSVPETLRALRIHADGRPLVIEIAGPHLGPEATGLTYWAHRNGFRACLRDPKWEFIATARFICTAPEVATGVVLSRVHVEKGTPALPGEVARSGRSAFVSGPAPSNVPGAG